MGKYRIIEGRDAHLIHKKNLREHRKKLKSIGISVDNKEPESLTFFARKKALLSPRKELDQHDGIAHNNLKLANRIFDIMEGPGIITHILKKNDDCNCHPGTLNFKSRVKEASRIHQQNISMAMRLDNVKPYYGKIFDTNCGGSPMSPGGKSPRADTGGATNRHHVPHLDFGTGLQSGGDFNTVRSLPGSGQGKKLNTKHLKQTNSARGIKSSDGTASGNNSARKNNVLLEYSKIQNGHVLDVAVIKEPFQDRYAIFGIDIDSGNRYELRLTSDDVSSILDGDILVTSLDNVEVWLALLNKVTLQPVDAFSKLASQPLPDSLVPKPKSAAIVERNDVDNSEMLEPEAPTIERPTTRPGGRGSRSQVRIGNEPKVPSEDRFEDGEVADESSPLHHVLIVEGEGDFIVDQEPVEAEETLAEQSIEEIAEVNGSMGELQMNAPQPRPPSQPKGQPTMRPLSSGRAGSRGKA